MPAIEPLDRNQSADARPAPPIGLKRRSVLLMIVLTIVSLGLYCPIWFLRRRAGLNRLDSPRKLQLWPFLIVIAWSVIQLVVGFASGSAPPEQAIGGGATLLLRLVQLAVAILVVVQCFAIKDILADHLLGPGDSVSSPLYVDRVELSALKTFFFQIFYLQHVINRHIVGSQDTAG
jgi:hypothetical protein